MKIICNKSEFAMLVRKCAYEHQTNDCQNCLFFNVCSETNAIDYQFEIMSSIEDICTIEDGD